MTEDVFIRAPEHELRRRLCAIARSQEGNDDPTKYWAECGVDPGPVMAKRRHWCGVFYLWCLHQADLLLGVNWVMGSGLSHERYKLKLTTEPKPGDLAYFSKNQHYAMVVDTSPGMVQLCNGNSRNEHNKSGPTMVIINEKPRSTVHSLYSIEGLLE